MERLIIKKKLANLPPFTAQVTDLCHEGRGIARIEGKTTFISGALPGETVEAIYTLRRTNYDEARVVHVITPSSARVTPACAHYGVCGGCSMQHMDQTLQIQHKQHVLLSHLQHFGKTAPETVLPPLTGPAYGYRRKARLGVRYVIKKEKLLIGFREANGRYLADVSQCEILDPRVGLKLEALRTLIAGFTHYDHIPQIEVAAGDKAVALIFRHMVPLDEKELAQLCDFGATHHFHIYLQSAGPDSVTRLYPQNDAAPLQYRLPAYDVEMLFQPTDFTQVNAEINQRMVSRALELMELSPQDTVLDLFCGLGNFTLPMARHCQHVTGVEGDATMVKRAYENAAHNQIENVTFYSADLAGDFQQAPWFKPVYNKLLIDPPRSGAQTIVEQLPHLRIQHIVYVSCNPATLARDASILISQGYRLRAAGVMDMFPQTGHVESIAVFTR